MQGNPDLEIWNFFSGQESGIQVPPTRNLSKTILDYLTWRGDEVL